MPKRKKLKVGIIGCGYFGNVHLDNLLKMEDVEITCLYNRGIDRLEKTGKKVPKARLYQDLSQMMLKEKLDAAVICLTPDAHGEAERLCCKKKINMYIEKPIGLFRTECETLGEEIKFAGVIVSVGYQERYSEPLSLISDILKKEPAGLVNGYWIGDMPGAAWWRQKELSGGQMVEQATHIADMFRFLFGEAESVYSKGGNNAEFKLNMDHDVEDWSSSVISFKSGVTATLNTGCYSTAGGKVGFEIYTPHYRIEYNWGRSLSVISGDRREEINVPGENHMKAMSTFIEAVRNKDPYAIRSNYDDALNTLRLTLAANESMKSGKAVKL